MNQNRVRAGVPTGGQFAAGSKAESSEQLGAPSDPISDETGASHSPPELGYYRPAEGQYEPRFEWRTEPWSDGFVSSPVSRTSDKLLPGETFKSHMQVDYTADAGYRWAAWTHDQPIMSQGTTDTLSDAIEAAEHASAYDLVPIKNGSRTPWGTAQYVEKVMPGVVYAGAAGHGGYKVNEMRNRQIPPALRNRSGWYEEDVEATIPTMFLHPDPDTRATAEQHVKDWLPREYAKATGKTVEPSESFVLRREAHDRSATEKGQWQGTSASRLGDGTTRVTLRRFRHVDSGGVDVRTVVMPSELYRERYEQTEFGAVFDPDEVAALPDYQD